MSLLTSLLTAAFAVSLLFFSGFHLHLVLTGQSTIEASLNRRARQNGGGGVAGVAGEIGAGAGASGLAAEESLSLGAGGGGSSAIDGGVDLELQRDDTSPPPAHAHAHAHGHHPAVTSFSAGSKRANWDAVFGSDPWLWFIPLNTLHETGYEFDFLYESEEGEDSEGEGDLRPQSARIGAALAGNDSIGSGGGVDSHGSLRDHDQMDGSISISRSDSDRRLSQDALADEEQSMSSLVRDLQMHD